MKRISLVLPAFLIVAGCEQAVEQVEESVTPVQISVVRPDSIAQYLKLTGGIEAMNEAFVHSKISERAEQILVKPGDTVKADQVLAVQSGEILEQSISLAEASLENANTQLSLARQNFDRMQRLFQNNAISRQQYDQSETQYKSAQAMVRQAEAQVAQSREQHRNSIITAPFAGKIAVVLYENGRMIPAGQPVAQIVNDHEMRAKLYVPAIDLPIISTGQKVIARFPAIPDSTFEGSIERINEAIDPARRAVEIDVRIGNERGLLKSGMFGQFLVETEIHDETIVLPDNVVFAETEISLDTRTGGQESVRRTYVYLVRDNRARLREVHTGLYSEGRIEVTAGLSYGDSVIVLGQHILSDDMPVEIVQE
jgi:RND family efflux transporter MFP subunit